MIIIDEHLVRRLVNKQFPQWAHLPIRPIRPGGCDNRSFRLGRNLSVRIPCSPSYAPQVEKEHRWLPILAPQLPLPISSPVAKGAPGEGLPWHWSVYRWLPGAAASHGRIADARRFARDLGGFLAALRPIDASDGPAAGAHSFQRGAPLSCYDAETRRAIKSLGDRIDQRLAIKVWDAALQRRWSSGPVWIHGDISADNLIVRQGRLSAVIDFGLLAVGDPACDLTIKWTFLPPESRTDFYETVALDDDTWVRARGWALWKALVVSAGMSAADPRGEALAGRVLRDILAEEA